MNARIQRIFIKQDESENYKHRSAFKFSQHSGEVEGPAPSSQAAYYETHVRKGAFAA